MKIISFNVNGIRAIAGKLKTGEKSGTLQNNSLKSLIREEAPDILCLQEIKTSAIDDLEFMRCDFRHIYMTCPGEKKGYSGVALLSREKPLRVDYGFNRIDARITGNSEEYPFNNEGRVITAEFDRYIIVTCYTPNSKDELARLGERLIWERVLRNYLWGLERTCGKNVILCGDLNCATEEIDIHNAKGNKRSAGFSDEEREEFRKMVGCGYVDTFRALHPDIRKYSYWSNFRNSRERNAGWRIDYVIVSEGLKDSLMAGDCLNDYHGSDHCPVMCEINI